MKIKIHFKLFIILCVFTSLIGSCGYYYPEDNRYKWKLTFEDNFDTFNSKNWATHLANGNRTIWFGKELQWYKDENVKVEDGKLKLIGKKESVYGKDFENEGQFDYTSGIICSSNTFVQAYGKWEMKVRFPFRKGYWPAFWLIPTQIPPLPEIDVFEYFGVEKNKMTCSHHWGLDYPSPFNNYYNGKPEPYYNVKSKDINGDFSDEWMIWSFECYPDKMLWKLDGKTVYEATEGIPTSPLYILVNVAVKDRKENDYKVDDSSNPYVMEIDYIKVYQMDFSK
jgi:beta-glucanase (GH16 family)